MDEPTVSGLGEFAMIRRMARSGRPGPAGVLVGPGDDAAVLRRPEGDTVACTDMLVEGRHFRLDWSAPEDVGRKAIAQNGADIAAMGAQCTAFLLAIGCPARTPARVLEGIAAGARAESQMVGAPVVGGDLVEAESVVISVTALGDAQGLRPVRRGGVHPGDVVMLAGTVGDSAAGLALLQAGYRPGDGAREYGGALDRLIAAHRRPRPPYAAGPAAARAGAGAMIDVSDGLVADAGHLAEASSVVIDLDSDSVPPGGFGAWGPDLRAAAEELGADPRRWALCGGEDHALVAAFPPGAVAPRGWRRIGQARSGRRAGVLVDGTPWQDAGGWSAFDR